MSPTLGTVGRMPCPAGHALEEKTVAGTSWFAACKTCARCKTELKAGMARHSCKPCKYHLCADCHAVMVEEWLKAEITVTVYRAAQPGVEEDTWQVCVERGANVGALRRKIFELYGLAPPLQAIRRDVDSAPLADGEPLGCAEGDVLHLSAAPLLAPLGLAPPMAGLAEAISGAMEEVAQMGQALQDSLDNTSYHLNFVLPAHGAAPERRCRLEVAAGARLCEVLEMVGLELDAEEIAAGLEFAGEVLPPQVPVHLAGLREGDTLMVVRRAPP